VVEVTQQSLEPQTPGYDRLMEITECSTKALSRFSNGGAPESLIKA